MAAPPQALNLPALARSRRFRSTERAAGMLGLLVAAPLIAFAALIVWVLSRRSPFIAHRRVGWHGQPFWMIKIRTMWGSAGEPREHGWIELLCDRPVPLAKGAVDPRVTSRFAAWLRRYSLDELPQLWHVATGEMRFVGPRPLTARELEMHYGAKSRLVLSIPPGLTGLWQVLGRNRLTYRQRLRLDVFLATHDNPALAWHILLATPWRVITGRDAC